MAIAFLFFVVFTRGTFSHKPISAPQYKALSPGADSPPNWDAARKLVHCSITPSLQCISHQTCFGQHQSGFINFCCNYSSEWHQLVSGKSEPQARSKGSGSTGSKQRGRQNPDKHKLSLSASEPTSSLRLLPACLERALACQPKHR